MDAMEGKPRLSMRGSDRIKNDDEIEVGSLWRCSLAGLPALATQMKHLYRRLRSNGLLRMKSFGDRSS